MWAVADATARRDSQDSAMSSHARRIVVAYDGSEGSDRALDAAADLVGYGSSLSVVHVRRPGTPESRAVDFARERMLRRRMIARYLEPCGQIATEVVEAARSIGADLVVVGRRADDDGTLGSVSSEIVRCAPCDVLVVR
jgi:nucleotide-binding universal stress UspA family protein